MLKSIKISEEMCNFFNKRGYPASVVEAGDHQNFRLLHRTKQKLIRYACLKIKSYFVKEQELL